MSAVVINNTIVWVHGQSPNNRSSSSHFLSHLMWLHIVSFLMKHLDLLNAVNKYNIQQAQENKRYKLSLPLLLIVAPRYPSPGATRGTSYSGVDADSVYAEEVHISCSLSPQTEASSPGGCAPCFFLHQVFPCCQHRAALFFCTVTYHVVLRMAIVYPASPL